MSINALTDNNCPVRYSHLRIKPFTIAHSQAVVYFYSINIALLEVPAGLLLVQYNVVTRDVFREKKNTTFE